MFIVYKDCFKDVKVGTREMEGKATGRGIMMAKVRQTSEVNT